MQVSDLNFMLQFLCILFFFPLFLKILHLPRTSLSLIPVASDDGLCSGFVWIFMEEFSTYSSGKFTKNNVLETYLVTTYPVNIFQTYFTYIRISLQFSYVL